MKRNFTLLLMASAIIFCFNHADAQNIGINADGSTPDANAMLDIKASNKGLLIPRTSTTSRIAIPNTKGLLVYDTTNNSFWYNDGSAWQQISNGSASLNGTVNYVAKFTGTSTAGNSEIFDDGTKVGIGTNTPLARLHILDSTVLFSALGDIPSVIHNTPTSLTGGRKFLWYPDKSALRAGYCLYDEWDSVNIGKYSIGLGVSNLATGTYSVSLGDGSGASGTSSFATGSFTNCNGDYAFTAGQYSTAKKAYCFATGYQSYANGYSSIAMGYSAEADGDYATALGEYAFASGNYASAIGYAANAAGAYSFSTNFNTKAGGNASFSAGNGTVAAGDYSFATGASCQANGLGSTAMGSFSVAGGDYSFALGSGATATNLNSYAIGVGASATGSGAFAIGDRVTAAGAGSVAMGQDVTAGSANSYVWGSNSNTTGNSSFIMGTNLFDGGHKGNGMFGDTDPWNAGSVGSGTDDQMICRFNNGYYFITGGNTNRTGMVANHGDNGWSIISDSTKKEKIIPIDEELLLQKIAGFRLCTWSYKGQDSKTFRHYGPMAQDFHAAFGHDALGVIGNDTLINQADFLGVSFTAIQALERRTEKIEQQQKQILELEQQNAMLIQKNDSLEVQLTSLVNTVSEMNKKLESLASAQRNSGSVAQK